MGAAIYINYLSFTSPPSSWHLKQRSTRQDWRQLLQLRVGRLTTAYLYSLESLFYRLLFQKRVIKLFSQEKRKDRTNFVTILIDMRHIGRKRGGVDGFRSAVQGAVPRGVPLSDRTLRKPGAGRGIGPGDLLSCH